MAKSRTPKRPPARAWAIVLAGDSFKQVPFTGLDQEGLLCFVCEGDPEWTRVANFTTKIVNHPNPMAEVG